jgi:hypothetical protein
MRTEGLVALSVKGAVATAIDRIGPLLEVEVVETMVAQTGGGGKYPVVTTVVGIRIPRRSGICFHCCVRHLALVRVNPSKDDVSLQGLQLGTVSCDSVASKDPCWSSFRLSGGGAS